MSNNPLFLRKYVCPLCKTSFKSNSIRSSAVYVERREPDLHVIYRGHSPAGKRITVLQLNQFPIIKKVKIHLPNRFAMYLFEGTPIPVNLILIMLYPFL
jgi:hypothetical protein